MNTQKKKEMVIALKADSMQIQLTGNPSERCDCGHTVYRKAARRHGYSSGSQPGCRAPHKESKDKYERSRDELKKKKAENKNILILQKIKIFNFV